MNNTANSVQLLLQLPTGTELGKKKILLQNIICVWDSLVVFFPVNYNVQELHFLIMKVKTKNPILLLISVKITEEMFLSPTAL